MRISFLTHGADHPLVTATAALLRPEHHVDVVDLGTAGAPSASSPPPERVDVCLLKARTPAALRLARSYQESGAVVLNSVTATARCQDRREMARLARQAGLPFAATRTMESPGHLLEEQAFVRPLVIKSLHSRRGDLVSRVQDVEALRELSRTWPHEPIVVQDFAENSGWDQKLWVVGDQVFAGLRRSELASPGTTGTGPRIGAGVLHEWRELARGVGAVFGLEVYGVDVIETADGSPLIVDVNAFPGMRGADGRPAHSQRWRGRRC